MHERDAIFRALREHEVRGVVLVGGDTHRPRIIRHVAAAEHLGDAPIELISSPLANHPIAAAAAAHPGLIWDAKAESVALVVDVARTDCAPRVTARMIGPDRAALHTYVLTPADLGR